MTAGLEGEGSRSATTEGATQGQLGEHECAYLDHVMERQMGFVALQPSELKEAMRAIEEIHAGGICPPTEENGGPTAIWAKFVQALKY